MLPNSEGVDTKLLKPPLEYIIMSHLIGVRIDDELLEKLKNLKVNISKTVREALIDEVAKREGYALNESLNKLQKMLAKEDPDDYVRLLRESRDER